MTPSRPEPADDRLRVLQEFAERSAGSSTVGLTQGSAWGFRRPRLELATVEVFDALDAVGIPAQLLKGAALADALYPPDRERSYTDIDLLVPPDQQEAAGAVLDRLGYHNVSELRGLDDVGDVLHATMWSKVHDEMGNVVVDLHWRLPGCQVTASEVWRGLTRDLGEVTVAGRVVPRLGQAALALHIVLHLAQHGPADHKAAADLKLALERWPLRTWERAARLAHELAADEAFAAGLRMMPDADDLVRALGLPPAEDFLWDIRHRAERPRGTFHLTALADAGTVKARLVVLRRSLLPSPQWIKWEYRWAADQGEPRLLAAYFLHLLRTPVWALRAMQYLRRRDKETTMRGQARGKRN